MDGYRAIAFKTGGKLYFRSRNHNDFTKRYSGRKARRIGGEAPEQPVRSGVALGLADWATPIAGLNARPTNMSAKDYYAMAVENLRTYPVYFPGREPDGYWEMLKRVGPQPLIEPEKLTIEADWIKAGQRVFDEADHLHLRSLDSTLITKARSAEFFKGAEPLPDGTVPSMRWVPTKNGVALGFSNCSNCHVLPLPDGTRIPGAPEFGTGAEKR
jgi:hypothetical protein